MGRIILEYSRSTENDIVLCTHIHDVVYSLNLWWDSPWMWEEGVPFLRTSGVSKNFPCGRVIFRYFWSMENNIISSHVHDRVHSLNSWWSLPWMWEERAPFFRIPGVSKNFPCGGVILRYFWSTENNTFSSHIHDRAHSLNSR